MPGLTTQNREERKRLVDSVFRLIADDGFDEAEAIEIVDGIVDESVNTVRAWQRGRSRPTTGALVKLAKFLNDELDANGSKAPRAWLWTDERTDGRLCVRGITFTVSQPPPKLRLKRNGHEVDVTLINPARPDQLPLASPKRRGGALPNPPGLPPNPVRAWPAPSDRAPELVADSTPEIEVEDARETASERRSLTVVAVALGAGIVGGVVGAATVIALG